MFDNNDIHLFLETYLYERGEFNILNIDKLVLKIYKN